MLGRLLKALRGTKTPDPRGALVRLSDASTEGRYAPLEAAQLIARAGCVWVNVCVQLNAQEVASTPLRVYRKARPGSTMAGRKLKRSERKALIEGRRGISVNARRALEMTGDLELVDDQLHPYNMLLEQGWPGGSGWEAVAMLEGYRSLTGNGYWAVENGRAGFPAAIWPMPSQYVRAMPDRQLLIREYRIGRGLDNEQVWAREQVLHVRGFNWQGDPYYGMGDVASVFREADTCKALTQFTLAALDNMVLPGVALWLQGAGREQVADLDAKLSARGGVANAFRSMALGGAVEPKAIQWQMGYPANFQFVQDDAILRDHIANAFQVPISLLTQDTAALAQAKVAKSQWQSLSIAPKCLRIEDCMNEQLTPLFQRALSDDSLVVCFDNPVKTDPDEVATRGVLMCGGPFRTVNEIREEQGLEPIEGGDVLRQDPSAVPASPFGMGPAPEDKPAPTEDDAPEEDDNATEDKRLHTCAKHVNRRLSDALWNPAPVILTKDDRARGAGATLTLTEKELQALLMRYFDACFTAVDDRLATGLDITVTASDLSGPTAALASSAQPIVRAAIAAGWGFGYDALGADKGKAVAFESSADLAVQAVRTYSTRLASSVGRVTAERITRELASGLETGRTMAQQREAVREMLGGQAGPRAEAIARTETARAHSDGVIAAWKASGRVKGKRWLLSGNPCPLCTEAERTYTMVPLDQPMVPLGGEIPGGGGINDYAPIDGPPLHPNCGCILEPVFEGED